MRRVCDSSLYGDMAGATQAGGNSKGRPARDQQHAAGQRRRAPPHSSHASAAAAQPSAPISFNASAGGSTNSSATTPRLPAPAPRMSKL